MNYSQRKDPWVVCKMPVSFKQKLGLEGVVSWAKTWKADVVIGQFEPEDDVAIFRRNGIIALAQDHVSRFSQIPNITGEYIKTGQMAADHFLNRKFEYFGFFGYNGVCWSDERCEGLRRRITTAHLQHRAKKILEMILKLD